MSRRRVFFITLDQSRIVPDITGNSLASEGAAIDLGESRGQDAANAPSAESGSAIRIEAMLAGAVALGVAYAAWFFWRAGYLPQPFLYDVHAPLVGLYETAFWANNTGTYDIGKNIYPPLSFVFMKLFSINACYSPRLAAFRGCDWIARLVLLGFFLANIVLVFRSYRLAGAGPVLPRVVATCLGLPMLYALQCGNVIVIAFAFFVLGYGGVVRSRWLRWLSLAVSINFKPYLVIVLVPPMIRRQWRWVGGAALVAAGIYGATWAFEGVGSPFELLRNLQLYAAYIAHRQWSDLYYATSYWPLVHFMAAEFSTLGFAGPRSGDVWSLALAALMRLAQLGVAVAVIAAVMRPAMVNGRRFAAMILAMVLTTITTGQSGYVQIFLFFLVFLEPWRGPTRVTILVATYLLAIPADYAFLPVIHGPAQSYLSGRQVMASFGVSVGQLARPGILLIIQFGLIILNLADSFGTRSVRRDPDPSTPALEPGSSPAQPAPTSLKLPAPAAGFEPATFALQKRCSAN